jgi:hypothetical protein
MVEGGTKLRASHPPPPSLELRNGPKYLAQSVSRGESPGKRGGKVGWPDEKLAAGELSFRRDRSLRSRPGL